MERPQFIGRVCRYVEIAAGGYEDSEYIYPGYLSSLSENLRGDKALLLKVCSESNFAGFVRAAFLAVQMVRYDPNETPTYGPAASRPIECLQLGWKALTEAFLAASVPLPTASAVVTALEQYHMLSADECQVWGKELDGQHGVRARN